MPDDKPDFDSIIRSKPRVFPYREILPYNVESDTEIIAHLDHIITNIYISLKAMDTDYSVGTSVNQSVLHWTRELNAWMQLKFDMSLATKVKLARLYYDLALADFDGYSLEKIVNTFSWLIGDRDFAHNVKPADLNLSVEPLIAFFKATAFPAPFHKRKIHLSKSLSTMCRLASEARLFFDPADTMKIYEEFLPLVCVISLFSFDLRISLTYFIL